MQTTFECQVPLLAYVRMRATRDFPDTTLLPGTRHVYPGSRLGDPTPIFREGQSRQCG